MKIYNVFNILIVKMLFFILFLILHLTKAVKYSSQAVMIFVSAFGAFSVLLETAGSSLIFGGGGIVGFLFRTAAVIIIILPFVIQNFRPADGLGKKQPVSDEERLLTGARRLIVSGLVGTVLHLGGIVIFILLDEAISHLSRMIRIVTVIGDAVMWFLKEQLSDIYELWSVATGAVDTVLSVFVLCALISLICLLFSGIYMINGTVRAAAGLYGAKKYLYIVLSFIPIVNIIVSFKILSDISKRRKSLQFRTT